MHTQQQALKRVHPEQLYTKTACSMLQAIWHALPTIRQIVT